MRHIRMIHDWGSNHLYLRHSNTITRVSTVDHSYKDVRETPIREYDSITSQSQAPAWEQAKTQAWMCRASKQGSLAKKECIHERPLNDQEYFLEPF